MSREIQKIGRRRGTDVLELLKVRHASAAAAAALRLGDISVQL